MDALTIAQPQKHCSRCKQHKQRDQFHERMMARDGLQDWCRECVCAYQRARREAKRAKAAELAS